ncbi:MAG: hypothetical protein P4N41_23010 [Negativicutes bacterium]|nr:hypothetical protein [Negativicutes bacterium]
MRKKWMTIILAVVYLVALSGSAFAWTSEIEDRPSRYGGAPGYYVWMDGYGFHLWAVPAGGSYTFSGTIRTDGRFYDIRGHRLDGGESFQTYPDIQSRFWFESLNPTSEARFVFAGLEAECGPHKIFFKLSASEGSEGIHFGLAGASYVSFDLLMNGTAVSRKQIWYGGSSWHPDTNVFRFENK